ncbi:MAG: hypothetical protein OEY52_07510 [Gammaproteobacteria bacterium]|nr:hypothetical protein [Gammaproteobacteria bacterium]
MSESATKCYAFRRLSPFQGFLQVIETANGQASSSNGINWRIQVRYPASPELAEYNDYFDIEQQTILVGFWSSEGGFHRVPQPPMVNAHDIEILAQPIIDELLVTTHKVPFEQIDTCELWLLDEKDYSPLVLIASCSQPEHLPDIQNLTWESTLVNDHSFTRSWSISPNKTSDPSIRNKLNDQINNRSGSKPIAQWFIREKHGNGQSIGGINIPENITGRSLDKADFPELLLTEYWDSEPALELIKDYLEWQAPFLLTLPHLSPVIRKRLEVAAFKQVFKVESQHKLWPEVIDKEKLKAVLIEAQMRRSNPEAGQS